MNECINEMWARSFRETLLLELCDLMSTPVVRLSGGGKRTRPFELLDDVDTHASKADMLHVVREKEIKLIN